MINLVVNTCPASLFADSFLQTKFWADFKNAHGWQSVGFSGIITNDILQSEEFSGIVLLRTLYKSFAMAYIPHFCFSKKTEQYFRENAIYAQAFFLLFSKKIREFLPKNIIFLRIDPLLDFFEKTTRDFYTRQLCHAPLFKATTDIQPPDTVVCTLQEPDLLLKTMKSKWRYNIGLAQKKGVKIVAGSKNDCHIFYELYKQTAVRDGISIHEKAYYYDLLSRGEASDTPCVQLYFAIHEFDYLAAIIVIYTKSEATYLYGCSANIKRNMMASYLLQWHALCIAYERGCTRYDFYGIPPVDDSSHPMYGLYRFKTGFGGSILHRPGSIDIPFLKSYYPYRLFEKIRAFYYKKIRKLFTVRKKS